MATSTFIPREERLKRLDDVRFTSTKLLEKTYFENVSIEDVTEMVRKELTIRRMSGYPNTPSGTLPREFRDSLEKAWEVEVNN